MQEETWLVQAGKQLLFASLLGIAGGIYIYQPIFEQYSRDQKELKEKMKLVQDSEEKKS